MLISRFGIVLLALALDIIICVIITKIILRKSSKSTEGVGCGLAFILILPLWMLIAYTSPKVVIITDSGEELEEKVSSALFSYDGHKLNFCSKYIYNQSDEILVLYPQYYSPSKNIDNDYEIKDSDVVIIEPNSFSEIEHIPNHFFYVPSSIRSKEKGFSVQWILQRFSVMEEEYAEQQMKQLQQMERMKKYMMNPFHRFESEKSQE